ncbi:phosphate acetyltransferase [Gynuella sunshinyii]|uniref:Phosphate acetyltransferase n=1 Tax=Gynuella sunshinyii YC6258 TaxID=1445510 RepID=A0A0C5VK45_9GAMM|nr:phosphate acetyltransferase [Gynuella sunshinyii]AJQ94646.1 phosphotransacetylase [Gynuella sunshinyii YC6258]
MHSFFIAPTTSGTGLTSVCLGLVRALDRLGVRVAFCKPIAQVFGKDIGPERSTHLIRETVGLQPATPLGLTYAQQQMALGHEDQLMEEIISIYQQSAQDADVVVVEGLVPLVNEDYIARLNSVIAKTLNSDIILVAAKNQYSSAQLNDRIKMTASLFGGLTNPKLLGCILNKVGAPPVDHQQVQARDEEENIEVREYTLDDVKRKLPVFDNPTFRCLGIIHWNPILVAPRTFDIASHLGARIISEGNYRERRVNSITLAARTVPNMIHTLKAGTLLVTPGDREDIFIASSLSVLNGVPLAGVLFTGDLVPDSRIFDLCQSAINTGLPIMLTSTNTFVTAQLLNEMSTEVPADDVTRMEAVMDAVAQSLETEWLAERGKLPHEVRLSPPAFRHLLVKRANHAHKRIVLPEGEEPRTIQAACISASKGIARCVLLGREQEIQRLAGSQGYEIPDGVEIIDPESIRSHYVAPLVELRKAKGMTEAMAESLLEDAVVLGTMMLAQNKVDGLVSGAVHTTANTIRPALQLIKTKPDAALVSSIFFMLLPDQVLVYGDCAVNPDPTAEQLADIAIQSGDSAKAFGIEPRIAMISYSTGGSGSGTDVEKVREATRLAKEKRPDLIIDGPLQYDAAAISSVAKSKAPDSPVAGKATVFVFPDLNTGNTTYKAVQRSANVVSIGPMLQGLKKPVNDLSRGALVEDIVYTIALTAIQADQFALE